MHAISPQWQKSKGCKGKKAKLAPEKAIERLNTNSIPTGSDFVSDNNAAVDSTEVNKKHHLIQQSTDIIKCNENQNSSLTISVKSRTGKKSFSISVHPIRV